MLSAQETQNNENSREYAFESPRMESYAIDSLSATSVESAGFANMPEDVKDAE